MIEYIEGYAYLEEGIISVYNSKQKEKVELAYGTFNDTILTTGIYIFSYLGWGILNIHTTREGSEINQAYAAGVLESYLTQKRIYNFAQNCFNDTPSKEVKYIITASYLNF